MKFILSFLSVLCLSLPLHAKTLKVAVIDSGYNTKSYTFPICKNRAKDFSGEGLKDRRRHGQHISHLIDWYAGTADYCQIPLKYSGKGDALENFINALRYAYHIKADIINISGGGILPSKTEEKIILSLLNKGIIIFAAAGNEARNLDKKCSYFPACYDKRIIVVGNKMANGKIHPASNFGSVIDVWENGTNVSMAGITLTGTSQATAIATGKFINYFHVKRRPDSIAEEAAARAFYKQIGLDKYFSEKLRDFEKKLPYSVRETGKYVIPMTEALIKKEIKVKWEFQ